MVEQPGGAIAMVGGSLFSQLGFARVTPSGAALGWRSLEGVSGQWPRMAQTPGGELLIVPGAGPCLSVLLGSSTCFGTYELTDSVPEILRVDGGGNPIWRRALSSSPGAGIDVVATPDGGALWLGEVGPTAADAGLSVVRLDGLGVVQWQTVYDTGTACFPTSMAATADGGFACTATCADGLAGPFRPIFLRGDADGTVASCTAAVGDAVAMPLPLVSTPGSQTLFTSPVSAQAPGLATIPFSLTAAMECIAADSVGSPYCGPAASNSSGRSARAHVLGSHQIAANDVTLTMTDGPAGALGYFLAGAGMGTSNPPGSQGSLCLVGSTIYRFSLSAQVADGRGAFAVTLPSPSIPNHGAILAGETWNFQAWFRDANPTVTSNFSDATSVTFQ